LLLRTAAVLTATAAAAHAKVVAKGSGGCQLGNRNASNGRGSASGGAHTVHA
jgi:hypothetical protein